MTEQQILNKIASIQVSDAPIADRTKAIDNLLKKLPDHSRIAAMSVIIDSAPDLDDVDYE